jgi:hypothetical protein
LGAKQLNISGFNPNLTKINKNLITALFTLKMTVTATKLTVHMKAAKM